MASILDSILGKKPAGPSAPKKGTPRTAQDTIDYRECYENGVIQVQPGMFSKTYHFNDISFKTKSDEDQLTIYENYTKFLNSLADGEDVFFTIVSSEDDKAISLESILPHTVGDVYDDYRKELSDMIQEKFTSSRNSISTKKYITVTVKNDSVDRAMHRFNEIDAELETNFRKISGENPEPLSLAERLEVLAKILNGKNISYWFEHSEEGGVSIDYKKLAKQNLTTKDIISPELFRFKSSSIELGENRYGQILYLDNIANWMNTNFIAELTEMNFENTVTLHIEPIPQHESAKMVRRQAMNISSQVMEKGHKLLEKGYSPDMIPVDLKNAQEQIELLQDDLMNRDQKLFYLSVTMAIFAPTEEDLQENSKVIRNLGGKYMCNIHPLTSQQERGINTVLPLGYDKTYTKKLQTSESLGVFIPFDESNVMDRGGFYYGVNAINKSLIIYNRLLGQNYNGLILGSSGSGKSFSAKREMSNVFLNTDADLFILDPDREYTEMAKAFGGTVIKLAPGNGVYINAMDLDIDKSFDPDNDPLAMKVDFICGFFETILGANAKLTPSQKAIVDRCLKIAYMPYLAHLNDLPPLPDGKRVTIDRNACPTLENLFSILMEQRSQDAQYLATIMEPYVTGTFNTFAKRTNVDLDTRMVVYDINSVGTNLREIALKTCMNDVWNRMMANRRAGKWTWFYIDEFHLLMSNDSTSEFLKSIWKRARKWQGVPTGITQNVEDLLESSAARAIINNTEFVYMMNQSYMDTQMLGKLLNLSNNDLQYITNVDRGHGLLHTAKQNIPFVDKFPQGKLYDVMTTAPKDAG